MTLTPEQISADKKLCDAATPGPWCPRDRDANVGLAGCDLHHEIGHFIAHFRAGARTTKVEQRNCRFTARARTALPEYIAEVERLGGLLWDAIRDIQHWISLAEKQLSELPATEACRPT